MTSTKQGLNMKRPNAAHDSNNLLQRGLRFTKSEKEIQTYTKFMIMRNPIDRFVSAYYDKMTTVYHKRTGSNNHWIKIRKIILKFNKITSSKFVPIVELSNFTNFILNSGWSKFREDDHWKTYAHKCQPCRIK